MHWVIVPKRLHRLATSASHARPQAPQFENDGSLVPPAPSRLTHVEPQHWEPAAQEGMQLPGMLPVSIGPETRASTGPASGRPETFIHIRFAQI
jgi:hypothetical protein